MTRQHVYDERTSPQFFEDCGTIYAAHRDAVSGSLIDFSIPQGIGAGRICSLGASGPIAACEHRMLFSRDVGFSDEGPSHLVNVGFCIGAGVEWTPGCPGSNRAANSVGTDSLFIQSKRRGPHSICYLRNLEYDFVSLSIPLDMLNRGGSDDDVGSVLSAADGFEAPMTPAMKASLASLRRNAFVGCAGRLYAEGKLFELLASVVAMLEFSPASVYPILNRFPYSFGRLREKVERRRLFSLDRRASCRERV